MLGGLWTIYLVFASGEHHSALRVGMSSEATHYGWRTSLLDVVIIASALHLGLLGLQRATRAVRRHFGHGKDHCAKSPLSRAHEPVSGVVWCTAAGCGCTGHAAM
jgi:hypothetical protein